MTQETIGAKIRHLRHKKEWSLRQLAAAVGVKSHVTVFRWENDAIDMPLSRIEQLAKIFDISPTTLCPRRQSHQPQTNGEKDVIHGSLPEEPHPHRRGAVFPG
jgi:transcriptional regulator with XRE-family HTH domain